MSASPQVHDRLRLGIIVGVAVTLVFVIGVGVPLALAHRQDLPLERWYGNAVVSLVSRVESQSVGSAPTSGARGSEAGGIAYSGSCASCHGAKGDGRGALGTTTYPPATDLTAGDAKGKSDAQLFAITKNGLGFTAMPGFGSQYNDQQIWALVTYIRQLQAGHGTPLSVVAPTDAQLAMADPAGDPVHRGAAVYFAQGCQACHGAVGNAAGELALRGRGETGTIRRGTSGMPAYDTGIISNADLTDLQAYMATFSGAPTRIPPSRQSPAP